MPAKPLKDHRNPYANIPSDRYCLTITYEKKGQEKKYERFYETLEDSFESADTFLMNGLSVSSILIKLYS